MEKNNSSKNVISFKLNQDEIKTPTQFVRWLWEAKYFEGDVSVIQVQRLAKIKKFTFSQQAIRLAFERASFLTRSGLINGVQLYSQVHPPTQKFIRKASNPNVIIFDSISIHPQIKLVSSKLFYDGHYQEAIFAAFKKVNNMVKEKSGLSAKDGRDLMLTSFSPNNPVLKLNKLKTTSERDEQEGFMYIFAGSMLGIRNPRGHDDKLYDEPKKAIEYICLASLLAKTIDKTRK